MAEKALVERMEIRLREVAEQARNEVLSCHDCREYRAMMAGKVEQARREEAAKWEDAVSGVKRYGSKDVELACDEIMRRRGTKP